MAHCQCSAATLRLPGWPPPSCRRVARSRFKTESRPQVDELRVTSFKLTGPGCRPGTGTVTTRPGTRLRVRVGGRAPSPNFKLEHWQPICRLRPPWQSDSDSARWSESRSGPAARVRRPEPASGSEQGTFNGSPWLAIGPGPALKIELLLLVEKAVL